MQPVRPLSPAAPVPATPVRPAAHSGHGNGTGTATRQMAAQPADTVALDGLTDGWGSGPLGQSVWVRLRSGVVLTMLLALVGALVAAGVAGLIVALAVAVRSAVS